MRRARLPARRWLVVSPAYRSWIDTRDAPPTHATALRPARSHAGEGAGRTSCMGFGVGVVCVYFIGLITGGTRTSECAHGIKVRTTSSVKQALLLHAKPLPVAPGACLASPRLSLARAPSRASTATSASLHLRRLHQHHSHSLLVQTPCTATPNPTALPAPACPPAPAPGMRR